MSPLLAQKLMISGTQIQGPLKYDNISDLISGVLNNFIFPMAGVIMFIMFSIAGLNMLLAGGDEKKFAAAKSRITTTLIGFFLLISSYFIVRLVAFILRAPEGIL